ncbi:DUF5067 domain-containing protein [Atopobiaceae bacterium 24-176]
MTTIKKLGAVACGSLLALTLGACGSSPDSQSASDQSSATAEQAAPAESGSKYAVTIDGAKVVKTYDDKDAVAVTFTFTNNSDEAEAFGTATSVTVYQDGVEQEIAMPADNPENYGNSMSKVKPGASITVDGVYGLANTTSPVEVEVTELFDLDRTVLAEKTFNLS